MSCTQFGYNSNTTPTQLLMSSQPASASAPSSASATQLSSPSSGCCESGRPIITDPLTGQTVCSCQYDPQTQLLNYQRLASAGIPLYSNPYAEQGYLPLTAEQSAFYTPSTNGFELKDNLGTWPYAASVYYPYDTTLAGYPFTNGYGVDLNGARRKNATRETTSTLKAWLSEHKKNPYPTKGEKIMLAIITKMTLTQVSTWFANARRRLKKENKMTWEPRNRVDDEENTGDNGDADKDSDKGTRDPSDRTTPAPSPVGLLGRDVGGPPTLTLSSNHDCDKLSLSARGPSVGGSDLADLHRLRPTNVVDDEDDSDDDKSISVSIGGHDCLDSSGGKGGGGGGGIGGPDGLLMSDSLSSPASSVLSEPASSIHSPLSVDSQPTPSAIHSNNNNNSGVGHHHGHHTTASDVSAPHKPRIWSIVDTATSNSTPAAAAAAAALAHHGSPSHPQPPPLYPSGLGGGGVGAGTLGHSNITKVKPLSARSFRLDYGSPYGKPASWFNGSYAAAAAAAAAAAGSVPSSSTESLLNPFSKAGGLMVANAAAASYSSLASALTTTTTLSAAGGGRASCVSTGLNKGLPPTMAALQRNPQSSPRFHGAFTLNSKLDCQVHQDSVLVFRLLRARVGQSPPCLFSVADYPPNSNNYNNNSNINNSSSTKTAAAAATDEASGRDSCDSTVVYEDDDGDDDDHDDDL